MELAISLRIPVSLDLNHRKQLGTLEELWAVVSPYCARFEVIVLSEEQLVGLCHIHELTVVQGAETDELYLDLMSKLQELWRCRRVALCRKARESGGQQRRWSLLTLLDQQSTISRFSTASMPVVSEPKEDIGGGSAWMAGFLHGVHFEPVAEQEALRRADLLASLCQETKGDHSTVTRAQLRASEEAWLGQVATLATRGEPAAELEASAAKIEATLTSLGRAGVLAIMRNKGSPDVAVRRGLELAGMGCRALEITMDSTDWAAVLSQLHERLPSDVVLGVGTVMDDTVCDLERAAALGASFALSPIDPIGFVEECSRLGILAVPSAFTSNECWQLHRRGVRLIKLFHAGLLSPSILKSMLDVTPLGDNLNIMPSGGVTPTNLDAWLDAGAVVVGMGSNLAGKDIALKEGTPEFTAAQKDWEDKGKAVAEELFVRVAKRCST
jgi:2-keto-3-deoxy-6-phosphogluconate aldolase